MLLVFVYKYFNLNNVSILHIRPPIFAYLGKYDRKHVCPNKTISQIILIFGFHLFLFSHFTQNESRFGMQWPEENKFERNNSLFTNIYMRTC